MLEERFVAVDDLTQRAEKLTREVALVVKKIRKASSTGDLQEVHHRLTDLNQLVAHLQVSAAEIASHLDFDHSAYLVSERFLTVLAQAAEALSLCTSQDELTLHTHPFAVTVNPKTRTLLIGKPRESFLRPTLVAQRIRKLREESGRIPAETSLPPQTMIKFVVVSNPIPGVVNGKNEPI